MLNVNETDLYGLQVAWRNGLLNFLSPDAGSESAADKGSSTAPVSVFILQADWSSSLLQGTKELVAGTTLQHQCPKLFFAGFLLEMMTQK